MKKLQINHDVEINHLIGTVDNVSDDETAGYGVVALNEFLRKERIDANEKIIPFHAVDHVTVTAIPQEKTIEDDTCETEEEPTEEITIIGANNTSIEQGDEFDPREGVHAYYKGEEIEFTVEGEFELCEVGVHILTYTASADGKTLTVQRKVTVVQEPAPTITGLEPLVVMVGEEFDPLEGVSATDADGRTVDVSVKEGN